MFVEFAYISDIFIDIFFCSVIELKVKSLNSRYLFDINFSVKLSSVRSNKICHVDNLFIDGGVFENRVTYKTIQPVHRTENDISRSHVQA